MAVLYEDVVVDAVECLVASHGWSVVGKAHAHQLGDDLVATKGGWTLRVEAKGAGSSKEGSKRFGLEFNIGQVKTHVSMAVMRAMSWVGDTGAPVRAAIALPDDDRHRGQVKKIEPALQRLGIGVFWVDEHKEVILEAPWEL